MWKLKALALSKADDDFDSSLDSENSFSKLMNTKFNEEEESLTKKEKKSIKLKENLSEDKISIFDTSDKNIKKIDWGLLYRKLFKNLGDDKKGKKISIKEIDLRIDSTLNKFDVKKGFIKKKKNFDLSRVGKIPKDNYISNIFENFSDNKFLEKKSSKQMHSKEDSKKNLINKNFFNNLLIRNKNEVNKGARTSYMNIIKDIELKHGILRNPKNLKTEKYDENLNMNQNLNLIKNPSNLEENLVDRLSLKKSIERTNTIQSKTNILKKFLSGVRESTESIQATTSTNFYDKEEIIKNFQHDIRSYEKEAAKLKQVAADKKHTKEIIDFLHFDENREKINLSKIENKFYSKSLLAEYKSRVELILAKINNYTKTADKNKKIFFK
jgi:hypothetical protein